VVELVEFVECYGYASVLVDPFVELGEEFVDWLSFPRCWVSELDQECGESA
jgi:hypothetical protein